MLTWPECMCTEHGECGNCWEKRDSCPTKHSQAVPLVEVTCNGDQMAGWLCAACHTELPANWGERELL